MHLPSGCGKDVEKSLQDLARGFVHCFTAEEKDMLEAGGWPECLGLMGLAVGLLETHMLGSFRCSDPAALVTLQCWQTNRLGPGGLKGPAVSLLETQMLGSCSTGNLAMLANQQAGAWGP